MAASTEPPPEGTPERAVYDKLAAHLPHGHTLSFRPPVPDAPIEMYRFDLQDTRTGKAVRLTFDVFDAAYPHDAVFESLMKVSLSLLDRSSP